MSALFLKEELVQRFPVDVINHALTITNGQTVLPWQAIHGDAISLPMLMAKAWLIVSKRGDGHLLDDATRHKCRPYEEQKEAPVDMLEYVEATEIMFRHVYCSLFRMRVVSGRDDPVWMFLLKKNHEMSMISKQNGNIDHVREFLLSIHESEMSVAG